MHVIAINIDIDNMPLNNKLWQACVVVGNSFSIIP